jgi:uncharacterized BrkB/YihY/UPF0761 family membrane protein
MITWAKIRLWPRLKQTVKHWKEDDGNLLAAAMAYYATLSFFPLLLILISALGLLLRFSGGTQDAQRELLALLEKSTSATLSEHVASILAQIRASAAISGPLGLASSPSSRRPSTASGRSTGGEAPGSLPRCAIRCFAACARS